MVFGKAKSEADLDNIAGEFIKLFSEEKIVAFVGEMGAGKTTFIKSLCSQLGSQNEISSPTFSIVNEYNSPNALIYHFDFYRIEKIEEAYNFGYESYFFSGNLCLIEWPEKIEELLPEETLVIKISVMEDDSRVFESLGKIS